MKLRTILAPAVLGVLALAPTAGAFATAPAGGDASTEQTFPAGDAPAGVDMTKMHTFKTTKDYRAVVSYSDLRTQNSNRFVVEFADLGGLSLKQRTAARSAIAHGQTPQDVKANIVEFRRSPSGHESSFGYKVNNDTFTGSDASPTIVRSTCSLPQRAVADYDADTITFIVPRRCWKPTSGSVLTFGISAHYAPGTWDGTVYPEYQEGKSDEGLLFWNYRPDSLPQ